MIGATKPAIAGRWVEPRAGGKRRSYPPLALALPALVVVAVMLLPLVYLMVRAGGADARAWAVVARPRTLYLLLRTIALVASVTLAASGLGILLAWLTTRTDLPGRRFWTSSVALPLVIPSYLSAFAFIATLGPRGMLQRLLAPLGVERLPELYGFWGALLVLTLCTYPYVFITVRTALRGLDPAMEESARALGDSVWRSWWRVTLPQLRPAIAAGGTLVALYALSDFGVVSLLRFDSVTHAIFLSYQAAFDRTPAAILGLMLVAITTLIISLEAWTRGRTAYYRLAPGAQRPASRVRLGRWRRPALLVCALVVALSSGLPLVVVGYWFVLALQAGEPWVGGIWAAFNSGSVAGLAALSVTLAALPIALLGMRYPSRLTRLIEGVSYVGHALPGLVIALALVFFAARYAVPIYQTLALLVVAYLVRFLPQGVGAVRSALLQIDPHLEEAARSLGRTPWAVLRTITLPLLGRGLLAAAALISLTTMKELPATLLLSPTGFETLAMQIWSATGEAFFVRAAWPALLLLLLAVAPAALLSVGDSTPDA